MSEDLPTRSSDEESGGGEGAVDVRKKVFAETLERKLKQGYDIESRSDYRAVLVMKGHRRRFGLSLGKPVRTEIWITEEGEPRSRSL